MIKTAARAATLMLALTMSSGTEASPGFVQTSGTMFTLADKPFYITGVNNHYLTYGTEGEVLRVLDDSVALGATVVRTFLQPAIGSLDQRVPTIWNWKNTWMRASPTSRHWAPFAMRSSAIAARRSENSRRLYRKSAMWRTLYSTRSGRPSPIR